MPEFHAYTEPGFRRAQELLREALAQDQGYAEAWAALSDCIARMATGGWLDWRKAQGEGCEAAARAVSLDPENGTVLAAAAWTFGMLSEQLDKAVELADRALALHPNSAYVRTCCGWAYVYDGQTQKAVVQFDAARRMSPLDPRGHLTTAGLAAAHLTAGNFDFEGVR